MNRGFGFYFSQAIKTSASTLYKRGNLIKFFAYFLMELLARVTVVFGSLFDLADVRQAKIAQKEGDINIPKSFKVASKREPLRTMITAIILEALLFIAGLLIIAIASCLLGTVGYIISLFVDTVSQELLVGIFLIPGGLIALVYFVIMPILLAPTAYIIETNPDITASEVISVCFDTMKTRGKMTTFLAVLIPALVEGAIIGLFYGACYLVTEYLWAEPLIALTLVIALAVIGFVAFILVAPIFALARRITLKSLFEDVALDPVNASKHTTGINIKKCKGVMFDTSEIDSQLEFLFDESQTDRIPVPETRAQIKQREKEEKQREKDRRARASQQAVAEEKPVKEEATAKATTVSADAEEEDGELLTVSDLIRDVEKAEDVAPAVEEKNDTPAEAETPATEEVKQEVAEEAPAEEAVKQEEPVKEAPADEPVKEEKEEEPKEEQAPVKKTATRTTTAKSTTAKSSTAKSATAKASTAKSTTAKATATKSSTAKTAASKPATKTTATKSTATKTTASKSTATKSTATKTSTASKPSTAKTTASKTTATKTTASKTTAKKADKPAK
ncbi:MAG: hypothetical protein HDQ88_03580 [Clostridia bacterium]|nr:hypothetical protein [Clostridia bacterium]